MDIRFAGKTRSFVLMAALAIGGVFSPAFAESEIPARVALTAVDPAIAPGGEATLELAFEIDPGWHVYGEDPGESGMPTTVEWTLPEGFEAGPLEWPEPKKFESDGILNLGYETTVKVRARVRAAADVIPGTRTIRARVKWLACREICVPGKADLSVNLPVRPATGPGPVNDNRRLK